MEQSKKRCGGFTVLEVLLGLTVLSVGGSLLLKWCVFQNRQRSILRKKQLWVPCVSAFLHHIRAQKRIKSCVGTWYVRQDASVEAMFSFVRKQPGCFDFKIIVEDPARAIGKTDSFYLPSQSEDKQKIGKSSPSKRPPEFLTVRFYACGKKQCLHTCFVPVPEKSAPEKFEINELKPTSVERFMLTPKTKPSRENGGK